MMKGIGRNPWVCVVLLAVFFLVSCVPTRSGDVRLPDIEKDKVLNDYLQFVIEGITPSEHTQEENPIEIKADELAFSIKRHKGVTYNVSFRGQNQEKIAETDGVLEYEIDLSRTTAGTYPLTIQAVLDNSIPARDDQQSKSVDIWIKVENEPPLIPSNPSPTDGATNQSVENLQFTWTCSDPDGDPLQYHFNLGTSPDDLQKITTLDHPNYSIEQLAYGTQYYWRVDADDQRTSGPRDITTGNIWTFTTVQQRFPVTFEVVGGNGTLTATVDGEPISSGDEVEQGKDLFFTATPNEEYEVKEWKINGVVVAAYKENTLTHENLTEALHVTVELKESDPAFIRDLPIHIDYDTLGARWEVYFNEPDLPEGLQGATGYRALIEGIDYPFARNPFKLTEWVFYYEGTGSPQEKETIVNGFFQKLD